MNGENLLGLILFVLVYISTNGQEGNQNNKILTNSDFKYLERLTKDVVESSRISPGQLVSADFGPNNTGGVLIRPGGQNCYPSFWIRDYAMSLDCGFITAEEQKHMLLLTASTQCDQTWITKGGSIVPFGAIADHIRIDDGLPVYFPGTYSYEEQGTAQWGNAPPYSDQFFFIHMAYCYVKSSSDYKFLFSEINGINLIDRMEIAYKVPPTMSDSPIIYTTDNCRGVDFGFRDAVTITGALCFPSILKFRASNELSEIFEKINEKDKALLYRDYAKKIEEMIPLLFMDQRGMLFASTGKSNQPDVWSTSLAVYFNMLEGEILNKTCKFLASAYQSGTLAYKGNIRHILTCDDYSSSTAWECSFVPKNEYQNGAYWGTPVGWVSYAISKVDLNLAMKLAHEYVEDLRMNDYRKGEEYGAPFECFHPSGHKQNPVYMTSVTCPYGVFKLMNK